MTTTGELETPMGQCAVTGRMVPEDELVTIQGRRVCAEGKAILLERLKNGELMPGELDRPTVLRRFGCILLDGLIVTLPLAIVSSVIVYASHNNQLLVGCFSLFSTTVAIIYFGELHARKGQSVGKMAGKTRVVNLDGSPITRKTAYVRALAYSGPAYLTGIGAIIGIVVVSMPLLTLVGIYAIANILFALFDRDKQRALHDRIAGTRVIQLS